jgi:L-seryl-tRNA(Ser) seleniumtransferase
MKKNFKIRTKREIPAIETLASDGIIAEASKKLARPLGIEIIRSVINDFKVSLEKKSGEATLDTLRQTIVHQFEIISRCKISRVINGTGILVHTNLGRAPLSRSLFDNIRDHVTGYGNLEFEVTAGKRGSRGELAEKYLALLSQSEAGAIVNNNAAALFLILNTLAGRRKVVISRGELVQIGGGFRIPDIIKKSGASLIEVGTTNITQLDDYKSAMGQNPALILKVHRSNFAVGGFTAEVGVKELAGLGREFNVPIINDLGSGVFIDTTEFINQKEPTVPESVRSGVDLTCFSGDKLLGGLQAGLIVGCAEFISRIKRNPIYRTMRVDKIVFSAMEELLRYYLDGSWKDSIKLWRLAGTGEAELYKRGQAILKKIKAGDKVVLEASQGQMGGGSLPEINLPSVALVFYNRLSPHKTAALFRTSDPPVIGRIKNDKFIIDLKAIDTDELEILISVIKDIISRFE